MRDMAIWPGLCFNFEVERKEGGDLKKGVLVELSLKQMLTSGNQIKDNLLSFGHLLSH
jgi:hypothetical protein